MGIQRRILWAGAGAVTVGLVLLGAGYAVYLGFAPERAAYPVQGIDVSHHQGEIDWPAVRADGVDFAYIKATEGGDFRDPRFAANWRAAGRAGLPRGAYHFFTLCRPGADQARNFITTVPASADALPPAVDLEFVGNCARRPARAEFLRELRTFLGALEDRYRVKPILYTTHDFYDRYLRGEFSSYGFWLRSLYFEPQFPDRAWLFWQFHDRGRRRGIAGPVDLNVYRYDRAAFLRLLGGARLGAAGPVDRAPAAR